MSEPEILGPRPGTLEARTSLALKIMAAVHGFAVILAMIPSPDPTSWLQAVTFGTVTGFVVVVFVVEAVALDRRRPWAYAAARPLLVVVGLVGVGSLLVASAEGRIRVPFDLGLAAWAWLGVADIRQSPRRDRRSVATVVVAAVLLAVPLTGSSVFGWGGLLDVQQDDLRATLEVDCGAPGVGTPPSIGVAYDWAWQRGSPFPSGSDVVVIGWAGDDGLGRPLYLLGDDPPSGAGIMSGRQVDPSATMARAVEAESEVSWHWGIELAEQAFAPGAIRAELVRTRADQPQPEPLTITATYIHLGIWRQDTAAVTCSW
ncbi:MAG: hypothetical protein EPO36_09085 [Chloroflexota bacterium]|nr:MAG: hypothetical protein EPO36_09085 [Chloroflexota bacterium]